MEMNSMKTVADFEQDVVTILKELTEDWDSGFDSAISPQTAIVADMGFESLDVVHLITSIEQFYQKSDFPFEDLLMADGHYVQDLTVKQVAEFLHQHQSRGK